MASTRIIISSTGQNYNLPGDHWTEQTVAQQFADSVPGIGSMSTQTTYEGGDKVITFSPRVGTKG